MKTSPLLGLLSALFLPLSTGAGYAQEHPAEILLWPAGAPVHDRPDISRGMAEVYLKYLEAGVPAELHVYANAKHGFGYKPGTTTAAGAWPERRREWLIDSGFLEDKQG